MAAASSGRCIINLASTQNETLYVFARHQPLSYTIFTAAPHRLNSPKRNHHKNGVAMFAQTKQTIYILSAIN